MELWQACASPALIEAQQTEQRHVIRVGSCSCWPSPTRQERFAAAPPTPGVGLGPYVRRRWGEGRGFLFFYFHFLQKYIFVFKIYRNIPAALLPGSRDLVAPLRGGRGFCAKNFAKIFVRRSLGAGRPAAGRPAPQAARQRGGRPWLPGCRATGS